MKKTKELDLKPKTVSTAATATVHIVKDILIGVEVEMSGKEWQRASLGKITFKDLENAKKAGKTPNYKAGQNCYEWLAYKQISTESRFTFADGLKAIKKGEIKKPSGCSTC